MLSKILRYQLFALALAPALLLVTAGLNAQGVYDDESDDDYNDLYSQITSYSGACGGVNVWSYLNGVYDSGANVYQEILSSMPGTDYSWNWGYSYYIRLPGGCQYESFLVDWKIGLRYTAWGPTPTYSNGICTWTTYACSFGTPTCKGGWGITLQSPCPSYMRAYWVVLNGTECIIAVGSAQTGPTGCS